LAKLIFSDALKFAVGKILIWLNVHCKKLYDSEAFRAIKIYAGVESLH